MKKTKKISFVSICLLLIFAFSSTAFAGYGDLPRVVDEADLLTEEEEEKLEGILGELRERHQMDFVVVTVDSTGYKRVADFADDYYDDNGYGEGYGSDRDGALLLISMEDRDVYISTRGSCIEAFTDYRINRAIGKISPYLSQGGYFFAFKEFASVCDDYTTSYEKGENEDNSEDGVKGLTGQAKGDYPVLGLILVSLIAGFVIAFIIVSRWKSALTSVRYRAAASEYLVENSLNVTESRDTFLYANVTRIKLPEPDRSSFGGGGGSSIHTSSSGASHGGGGGHF